MNVLTITPFGILQKLNATRGWGDAKWLLPNAFGWELWQHEERLQRYMRNI